ncbi:hypothetical protein ACHAW5_005009 [Stephanodiscus triporus]|uniref:Uncharacterized protein n=1 Tax=Stephanodiscus triporus TaxID=2934178 RepID=A0ABD3P0D3_9STRA
MLRQIVQIASSRSSCRFPPSRLLKECAQSNPLVYGTARQLLFTKSAASFSGSGDDGANVGGVATPTVKLCQVNNHPDFRLRQAKKRTAFDLATGGCAAKTADNTQFNRSRIIHNKMMNENPIRSNDGTSSGALAAERLRNARRNAIENMIETFPGKRPSRPRRTNAFSQPTSGLDLSAKGHGLTIEMNENPVRSNDGTSSGALVADRLRQARRKAFENMSTQLSMSLVAQTETSATSKMLKEKGIAIQMIENPVRSSDGTSSGALAADRLRMSRRKALEHIKNPHHSGIQSVKDTTEEKPILTSMNSSHAMQVKEHGLAIQMIENRIRSSDGTSSGALAADRLRQARRKAVENMKKPNKG